MDRVLKALEGLLEVRDAALQESRGAARTIGRVCAVARGDASASSLLYLSRKTDATGRGKA
jgi:hypothetical protein